jgi:hypothetical protein
MRRWLPVLTLLALSCAPRAPAPKRPRARADEALLDLRSPRGALVLVDGKVVGEAPFATPARIPAGERVIDVVEAGHEPLQHELHARPGRRYRLSVDLAPTAQRVAAWVVLATGGAGVTAGIVLGALASAELQSLQTDLSQSGLYPTAAYEDFTLGAGLAGGLGAALLAIGGALFLLDTPAMPNDAARARLTASGVALSF